MAVPLWLLKEFTSITELPALVVLALLIPLGVLLYAIGLYLFYREAFYQVLQVVRKRK